MADRAKDLASRVVVLKRPVSLGDGVAPVTQIDLSKLDELTGADVELCIREAEAASGQPVVAFEISTEVYAQLAARASGIDRSVISKVHPRDYRSVMSQVRSFLLDSDSE